MKINAQSPENIVFQQEPNKTFTGRIVHGITGEPIGGAFVVQSLSRSQKSFSDLTVKQWQALNAFGLHTDKSHQAALPLLDINKFDYILRSDHVGVFKINSKPQRKYWFVVFAENFMPFTVSATSRDSYGKLNIDLEDIKLFPAARVGVNINKKTNSGIRMFPKINKTAPSWAKVFKENMGFGYDHDFMITGEVKWLYVPSDVKFKLSLKAHGKKWAPYLSDAIKLKQGEEKDLGDIILHPN